MSDALVVPRAPAAKVAPSGTKGTEAVGGGRVAAVTAATAAVAPHAEAAAARVPDAALPLASSAATKSCTVCSGGTLLLTDRCPLLLCDERDGVAERPRPLPLEFAPFSCTSERVAGFSAPHLWQSRRRRKVDVHPHSTQSQNCCGSEADAGAEADPLREPAAG